MTKEVSRKAWNRPTASLVLEVLLHIYNRKVFTQISVLIYSLRGHHWAVLVIKPQIEWVYLWWVLGHHWLLVVGGVKGVAVRRGNLQGETP